VKAGKLKALAVAGPQRARELPGVPTALEAGFPYLQASARFGLFAPAGTPSDLIRQINREVVSVLGAPGFGEKHINSLGYQRVGSSPEELLAAIREETSLVGEMARAAKVQPE
jgi:tripartite-type tricarboxylate transporter receptor subunit TctC